MSYADKRDQEKVFDSDEAGVEWNPNSNLGSTFLVKPSGLVLSQA